MKWRAMRTRPKEMIMLKVFAVLTEVVLLTTLLFGAEKDAILSEGSVVQIAIILPPKGDGGSVGTGFVVRADGLIATAAHVYLKALSTIVELRAGSVVVRRYSSENHENWAATPVILVGADFQHDLVLLKMAGVDAFWKDFGGIKPLTLDDASHKPADGDLVGMRGYFGFERFSVFLRGSVSGFADVGPLNVHELLMTLPAVPGQSGSPVVSLESGFVIGVVSAIVTVGIAPNTQPVHSGMTRVVAVEHLKRLVDSVPK
jgi:S1-C subfamily serine protease